MNLNPQHSNFDETLSAGFGLLLGVLFMVGGFWVRHIDAQQRATLNETQGTIVDSVRRRDRNASNNQEKETYAPVIEFLANGKRTRFTGKYESYRSSQGRVVVVRYDPNQPTTTARVVEPLEGLTAWGMVGVGGIAVVYSAGALLRVVHR